MTVSQSTTSYASENPGNCLMPAELLQPRPSPLQWRHNGRYGSSNHRRVDCLLNCLFRRRSQKHQSSASLSFVRGIHQASNAESVFIWWRHHAESSLHTQTQKPRRFASMFTHMIYIQIYLMSLDVVVLTTMTGYHNAQGISANAIQWFDVIIIMIGWISGICWYKLNGMATDNKLTMYQYNINLRSCNA